MPVATKISSCAFFYMRNSEEVVVQVLKMTASQMEHISISHQVDRNNKL